MFRRIVTVVATFGVSLVLLASAPAQAQPPTSPPTIDVTCHGYDEGATRAYNCIPVASQQHLLATFVPPVGSVCNGGQVAEFPPGRIVFQIRCQDGEGGTTTPTPQPTTTDFTVLNVRRYKSFLDEAHWLYYDVQAHVEIDRMTIPIRFFHTGFFTDCTDSFYDLSAGERQEGLAIPDVCGSDTAWSAVELMTPEGRTCTGCRRYTFVELPESRNASPTAPKGLLEEQRVLEDFELRLLTDERR